MPTAHNGPSSYTDSDRLRFIAHVLRLLALTVDQFMGGSSLSEVPQMEPARTQVGVALFQRLAPALVTWQTRHVADVQTRAAAARNGCGVRVR